MINHHIRIFGPLLIWIFFMKTSAPSQLLYPQHEPDLRWQTLTTKHFQIHFPSGFEELGYKIGAICESVYDSVSRSLNYYPGKTHVIVHTRVDFPEGTVSPLPWRMELYITEPQGNILGSKDEWLRILITHEFTHIVQLRKRRGISALTYPLFGEFNTMWQQITPTWFIEGFATFNETRYTRGGRGRAPFHWMQLAAPIQAGRPWRLENTNYPSRKHQPSKRMPYVSGYYLSHFINKQYGTGVWAKILDRYATFPLLGFGRAVKSVTGKSLKQLYAGMLEEFSASGGKQNSFAPSVQIWRKPGKPEDQHSPRWVDGEHLMVYRKSFDDLQELILLDRSGKRQRILQRVLAKQDNSFTTGKNVLVWAESYPHPRFTATIYSDLKLYDRKTMKIRTLTHNARLYNPDLSPDEAQVVAVQTALPTTRLVTVSLENGKIDTVLEIPNTTLLNPRWSPDGKWIAFALKDSTGKQDIAIVEAETGFWRFLYPTDSYHDNNPCWTPDGQFVLYTSDLSGIFNIWAVDIATGKRWMVTDSELGAFTPDVSPDGRELAFTQYTYTGFTVATMPLDSARWLPENAILSPGNPMLFTGNDSIPPLRNTLEESDAQTSPYRPWSQILRPQGWVPYPFRDESGSAIGLFATSEDALHRHAWYGNLGVSTRNFRPSVNFYYTYRRWWPELTLRTYSLPQRVFYQGETGWWRKQGIELSMTLPLLLEMNVYTSFFQPLLRIKHETRRRSSGEIQPVLKIYRGVQIRFDLGRTSRALRDIGPHRAWFITAFADWTHPTLGSEFNGQQFSTQVDVFLPTFIPHHQIEFLGRYQRRRGNYNYSFYGALPVGYGDDVQENQLRFKLAYILPLAYLEWPIPFLPIYVDYLDAAVFYDWGTSWNNGFYSPTDHLGKAARYSTGVQITSVNYFFQRFRIRLGAIFFYRSESQTWDTLPVITYSF